MVKKKYVHVSDGNKDDLLLFLKLLRRCIRRFRNISYFLDLKDSCVKYWNANKRSMVVIHMVYSNSWLRLFKHVKLFRINLFIYVSSHYKQMQKPLCILFFSFTYRDLFILNANSNSMHFSICIFMCHTIKKQLHRYTLWPKVTGQLWF